MPIIYDDIKHRAQPPLDCTEVKDLRGRYFYNRVIVNYENTDFTGCVLYHCYPSGIPGATEYNPAKSEEEVTLKGADLNRAVLDWAYLQGANLQGANLTRADLQEADLRGADFEKAKLGGADFKWSYLMGANLSYADLEYTTFDEANLEGANLEGATYNKYTVFPDSITQEQLDSMIFVEDDEDS